MILNQEDIRKNPSEAFRAMRKIIQEQKKRKGYTYNQETQQLEKNKKLQMGASVRNNHECLHKHESLTHRHR